MADDSGPKGKTPPGPKSKAAGRIPSGPAAEVALPHQEAPVRFQKPKRIHPRRVLPFVREGVEREFHSTTPQAMIAPEAHAAGDDLCVIVNTELTQPGQQQTAGNVGEPASR